MSLIQAIKQDGYRYGNCQVLVHDRRDTSMLKEGFLSDLYFMLKGDRYNRKREGNGILETLFCGMTDLSFDSIVPYLSKLPLAVMGVWNPELDEVTGETVEKFEVAGVAFPTVMLGGGDQKACLAGYGFLPKFWGKSEMETLTVLGLALLFSELDVLSVHGIRYADNDLTARFMGRFGFHDVGEMPRYMLRRGKLVSAVMSTLSVEDFEANLSHRALEAYRGSEGRRSGSEQRVVADEQL